MRFVFCRFLGWHFPCDRSLTEVWCRRCGQWRVQWISEESVL
jgi:hypothetical protein